MKMTRRDFLKWMVASGVALGIGKMDIAKAEEIINAATSTPVIWLQAAGCSGCTLSFLDMVENETADKTVSCYNAEDILMNKIELKYHSTLMASAASECMEVLNSEYKENGYILVVEGGIPTGENGNYCIVGERDGKPLTALQALKDFAVNAKYIIAAGTCSAFRGVSGAGDNLTAVKAVDQILTEYDNKVINLPGCPVHPYILGGTIVKLLLGETLEMFKDSTSTSKDPTLQNTKRPLYFYPAKLHANTNGKKNCPLLGAGGRTDKATTLGTCAKCFENIGCRGHESNTIVSCYTKLWGTDWKNKKGCLGSGSICIGCSNPSFPFTSYATDGSAASSSIYNFKTTAMK